jgi:spore maturation protein CgeB
MRFLFYTHSLVSDWNHGNAHFLRGVMRDLLRRGHDARALEPAGGWSRTNLLAEAGPGALDAFEARFPDLKSETYGPDFDHEAALDAADVVVVHEWTDPALVARIGRARAAGGRFALLFHDTHHRAVTPRGRDRGARPLGLRRRPRLRRGAPRALPRAGWGRQVVTWHEAADTTVFRPLPGEPEAGDLVWVGNWGDGERARSCGSSSWSPSARSASAPRSTACATPTRCAAMLAEAGLAYRGWIANAEVPRAFARHRVTVHVPRAPYVAELPGIPTIRPFEALACGIPLVSAPWEDARAVPAGRLPHRPDGAEMRRKLDLLVRDPEARAEIAARGLETIRARHTCRHRVDELLTALAGLGLVAPRRESA